MLEICGDPAHNDGRLFVFKHGVNSRRNDAYAPRKKYSGYIKIIDSLKEKATILINKYECSETPSCQSDFLQKYQWLEGLYELSPIKYIKHLRQADSSIDRVVDTINTMLYLSKCGANNGKDFELALKESFELFREIKECEIISGSGDTDIVCGVLNEYETIPYKINIDAKKSGKSTQYVNAKRLMMHINKNGSKYCIVVSPKFAIGVKNDIAGDRMIIEAETLGRYISKDCLSSSDGFSNFTQIDKMMERNYGKDITPLLNDYIDELYTL